MVGTERVVKPTQRIEKYELKLGHATHRPILTLQLALAAADAGITAPVGLFAPRVKLRRRGNDLLLDWLEDGEAQPALEVLNYFDTPDKAWPDVRIEGQDGIPWNYQVEGPASNLGEGVWAVELVGQPETQAAALLELSFPMALVGGAAGLAGAVASASDSGGNTPIAERPVLDATPDLRQTATANAALPTGEVGMGIAALMVGISESADHAIGIAVIGLDEAFGQLYFSLDGGLTWQAANALSASHALLLTDNEKTRLYFRPLEGQGGTLEQAFVIKAWNGTTGQAGQYGDTEGDAAAAFSQASDTCECGHH